MMKKRMLSYLLLISFCVFIWLPLWMMVCGTFMGNEEITKYIGPAFTESNENLSWSILPVYPTLRPYVELLLDSPNFFVMFWNSCKQVIPGLLGQLIFGVPAAWSFARFHFKGKNIIFLIYIVLMIMPFQVTMVSSYLVLNTVHLMNTNWALIIPNAFSTFPVFIMTKFFSSIPKSLLEAARIDGAGELKVFWFVGIPLGASGILSALVLGFLEEWNAIEQPLTFLKNQSLWPLSLYLPEIAIEKL